MNKYIAYALLLLNGSYLGAVNYAALGTKMGHLLVHDVVAAVKKDKKASKLAKDEMSKLMDTPDGKSLEKLFENPNGAKQGKVFFEAQLAVIGKNKNSTQIEKLAQQFALTPNQKKEFEDRLDDCRPFLILALMS